MDDPGGGTLSSELLEFWCACSNNVPCTVFPASGLRGGLPWTVHALCLIPSWREDMCPVFYESKLFLLFSESLHRKKRKSKWKSASQCYMSDESRNFAFRQPKCVLGGCWSRHRGNARPFTYFPWVRWFPEQISGNANAPKRSIEQSPAQGKPWAGKGLSGCPLLYLGVIWMKYFNNKAIWVYFLLSMGSLRQKGHWVKSVGPAKSLWETVRLCMVWWLGNCLSLVAVNF